MKRLVGNLRRKSSRLSYLLLPSLLFLCTIFFLSSSSYADPLDNWYVRNYSPGYDLNGVAYGNGTFVVVGDNGVILTSSDGANWTPVTSGTTAFLTAVTYGNGRFVAVGNSGSILISSNGTSWSMETSGTTSPLNGITYGNGLFVAVGIGGSILTSPDGLLWASRQPGNPHGGFIGVAYGNGNFVALGYHSNLNVSTDGITWSSKTIDAFNNNYFLGIGFGGGVFVVLGQVGTFQISPIPGDQVIYTSTDGSNWTQTYDLSGGRWLNGATYGNGYIVTVGTIPSISIGPTILSSQDGAHWTVRRLGEAESLKSIAYGGDTFVAVGSNNLILQSDVLPKSFSVPMFSNWGIMLLAFFFGLAAIRFLQKSATL